MIAILVALGGVPKRSNGTRCKRVGSAFAGSNPAPATFGGSLHPYAATCKIPDKATDLRYCGVHGDACGIGRFSAFRDQNGIRIRRVSGSSRPAALRPDDRRHALLRACESAGTI